MQPTRHDTLANGLATLAHNLGTLAEQLGALSSALDDPDRLAQAAHDLRHFAWQRAAAPARTRHPHPNSTARRAPR